MRKIQEECGVFGIYSPETTDLAPDVYYGLFALQHRGQSGCGIVVNDDGVFKSYKDVGLVNDVFTPEVMSGLGQGNMALGHVRYGATGDTDRANTLPLLINHIKGRLALAQNGAIINYNELRRELEMEGSIFQTTGDTEVIAYTIIKERIRCGSIEEAVNRAMDRIEGAYSLVVMSPKKMIACRDKHGFRPLCYGTREDGSFVVASESCALDAAGATLVREIEPGEIVVFKDNQVISIRDHCNTAKQSMCVFEYVYFARPDSVVEGCSVHEARKNAGRILAQEHPVEADVVIGVPDSGNDAALGYSLESGIPYGIGLIKNKYIGRTFIAPQQKHRENRVRIKLNPVEETVRGKRVVLVDDSIVRGTTCARIVKLIREAGAKEIHMRVSAPPFINPCYYGTDINSKDVLIACRNTVEQTAKEIGVDSLGYISLEGVRQMAAESGCKGYCVACFNGEYPTAVPSCTVKDKFEKKISEKE